KPLRPRGQSRRCPSAVCGNDLRQSHWTLGREAVSNRWMAAAVRVHEPEDLPRLGSDPGLAWRPWEAAGTPLRPGRARTRVSTRAGSPEGAKAAGVALPVRRRWLRSSVVARSPLIQDLQTDPRV